MSSHHTPRPSLATTASPAVLRIALAAVMLCWGGCDSEPSVGASHEALIVDHGHGGLAAGFYFLPPIVRQPVLEGAFEAGLAPVVVISARPAWGAPTELARYTTAGGPGGERVRVEADSYLVNWHTDQFGLDWTTTYRIDVLLDGRVLGFADVDVVGSGRELRMIDSDLYVPLVDGRTLPIKFFLNRCAPVECVALDACHQPGVCLAASGLCTQPPVADGNPCDDGDACTTADGCQGGACVGGPPRTCDDGNPCTDDACDAATGCVTADNTAACDDGDACTTADGCSEGACIGGPTLVCDDGSSCSTQTHACEPSSHWRLIAGSPDRGLGGPALDARLTGSWQVRGMSNLAYHADNRRLYFYDTVLGRFTYVDPSTGRWLDSGLPAPIPAPIYQLVMAIDPARDVLYYAYAGSHVFKADLATRTVSVFYQKAAPPRVTCQIALDANGDLYTCVDQTGIFKIPVNPDGTAGMAVRVLGNGTSGPVTDGVVGTASPFPAMTAAAYYLGPAVSRTGDVYVTSGSTWRVRAGDQVVESTGAALGGNLAQGRTGDEILGFVNQRLVALDGATHAVTPLAGVAATSGEQGDGAAAVDTAIRGGEGVMVTPEGRVYFVDGDNGQDNFFSSNVRVRTIDPDGRIRTVAGSPSSTGHGAPPLAARFSNTALMQVNPYDHRLYTLESSSIRTVDFGADVVEHFAGSGITTEPSGPQATSAMYAMRGVGFYGDAAHPTRLRLLGSSYLYRFDGVGFTRTAGSLFADSSAAPVSPCDGHDVGECWFYNSSLQLSSDTAGRSFFISGTSAGGYSTRLYEIDAVGIVTQLAGNDVVAFTPDCTSPGCARTSSIQPRWGSAAWDPIGARVLFMDLFATGTALRAVDLANGTLTTVGNLAAGAAQPLLYDGSRYYYYTRQAGQIVSRMDVVTGVNTDLAAPPFRPTLPVTGFVHPVTGNPVVYYYGAFYEYLP